MSNAKSVTILGAGLAGSLMAILLARRGTTVRLLERHQDLRKHAINGGRSINLALADRGLHAMRIAGVLDSVQPLLIPMSGRILHDINGHTQFVSYGQREHEVIYSVSRSGLTQLLLNYAEQLPNVELQFDANCSAVNLNERRLTLSNEHTSDTTEQRFDTLIAADGYNSMVRHALVKNTQSHATNDTLPHGYKELTLAADATGKHQLDANALHIWPRGGFMLIALPNIDGSFTVTLFLPFETNDANSPCFAQLHDAASVNLFFQQYFPDALSLMPQVAEEFLSHPIGKMNTIRSPRWTDGTCVVLIGDAAHAIVPFHGQGMNCAFEDCVELDQLLQHHSFAAASTLFEQQRKPNADAIADMALENYTEMRDTVRQPKFVLQKELAFELERRFPTQFIPRYSMVMFHHEISYALAYQRGQVQAQLLDELTLNAATLDEVDMALATQRVKQLLPLLNLR